MAPRLLSPALSLGFVALVLALAAPGCAKGNASPRVLLSDVERCERGAREAGRKPTLAEGSATYYRECSAIYVEPLCREAFVSAAGVAEGEALPLIAEGCRKAYCPLVPPGTSGLCSGGALPTGADLLREWPRLNEAIVAHDSGPHAARVTRALLVGYAALRDLATRTTAAPSAAPSAAPL
ncbi:MAG: hypothetical protein FJ104_01265, partial [Deltaproteobacteria bacterium]|nr:hypothetical protein [Deltaproteobacteria bacterium]